LGLIAGERAMRNAVDGSSVIYSSTGIISSTITIDKVVAERTMRDAVDGSSVVYSSTGRSITIDKVFAERAMRDAVDGSGVVYSSTTVIIFNISSFQLEIA
jgi:hypothetical protein